MTFWWISSASWETRPETTAERSKRSLKSKRENDARGEKRWRGQETEAGYVKDLHEALLRLAPDQREALLLVGVDGISYDEPATVSDCPVGTIKSRVNRARIRLAETHGRSSPRRFSSSMCTSPPGPSAEAGALSLVS
jgi:DNA-directed RNA polymerase specialized sigma24 family protein